MTSALTDQLNRPLRDLRISVTDRCNFRCVYCMPKEIFGAGYPFLPTAEMLTFEEIARLGRIFAAQGVQKFRLTGGEPLARRNLEQLVGMLAEIDGIDDIALTTNGSLLTAKKAQALKAAGLQRITISLDSLDEAVFQSMNDVGFPAAKVLQAIDNALAAGLNPVKIDMVVKRGHNEASIIPMADHFRGTGVILRFIEFMDVGSTNGWRMQDVVTAQEVIDTLSAVWPLEPLDPNYVGEVANRWRYLDGQGEIGIIASVTMPFCGDCSRARLSADGQLYTCLFGIKGHDFRALLRSSAGDDELAAFLRQVWGTRVDRYSEIRSANTIHLKKVEMSRIGG
jgi:cyclic pyranopterin phosphate synthase